VPYESLACPFCNFELLDKQTVEFLIIQTAEHDSVGTSIVIAECSNCHRKIGIIIASDTRNWALLAVVPDVLLKIHEEIRNLLQAGMSVEEIVKRVSTIIPTRYAS
jgi:hypothetical protein